MDSSRKTFWEVVLSSGLGAGIATIAAVAVGFPWWPAAIVGAALVVSLSYRPREFIALVRGQIRAVKGSGSSVSLEDVRRWAYKILSGMFVVCCLGAMAAETCLLFVMLDWVGARNGSIFQYTTLVVSISMLVGVMLFAGFGALAFAFREEGVPLKHVPWLPIFRLYWLPVAVGGQRQREKSGKSSLAYSSVRGWTYAGVRTLFLREAVPAFVFPLLFVAIGASFLCDIVLTIVFAFASGPRLSVMWGTMIGGTIGYFAYVANPVLPIATFVGMLAGGAIGGGVYCLRQRVAVALQAA